MLGAVEEIIALTNNHENAPWMFHFFPQIQTASKLKNNALNPEEILSLTPDLLILPRTEKLQESFFHQNGIETYCFYFKTLTGLLETLHQTAEILGTDFAKNQASSYQNSLNELLLLSQDSQKSLSERPKILHICQLSPLHIDGEKTLIDEWIKYAGGANAATIAGNKRPITKEQLLLYNPDIILLSATTQYEESFKSFTKDPFFKSLKAFKKNKIYINPAGIFLWDRYGTEILLQIFWLSQIILETPDFEEKIHFYTKNFYQKFFKISPSDAEISLILSGKAPSS